MDFARISRPAEKTKPWFEYRQIFITDKRIAAGVAFCEEHAERLDALGLAQLVEQHADLFEELRALRKRLADTRGVPAYVVFSDASLREMASTVPMTDGEFLAIGGVGAKKLETYGDIFLDTIRTWKQMTS